MFLKMYPFSIVTWILIEKTIPNGISSKVKMNRYYLLSKIALQILLSLHKGKKKVNTFSKVHVELQKMVFGSSACSGSPNSGVPVALLK